MKKPISLDGGEVLIFIICIFCNYFLHACCLINSQHGKKRVWRSWGWLTHGTILESASTIMGNIPDFSKQLSNNWIAPQLLDVNKKCVHVSEMQIDNFYIFSIQYWFIFLEHNDINHLKNLVRYCDFIPKSIGNRMVLQSTPNGNCIFNAISILMYGNESMAMMLKVAAVANMVDQLIPFTKYVSAKLTEYCSNWKWNMNKRCLWNTSVPHSFLAHIHVL